MHLQHPEYSNEMVMRDKVSRYLFQITPNEINREGEKLREIQEEDGVGISLRESEKEKKMID